MWDASLPAWILETSTRLTEAPGVQAVTSSVLAMIPDEPRWATCVQGAMATCTATGFETAAVTAVAWMAGSAPAPAETRRVRRVSLKFDRPHAVVALARRGAWEGVPLVHAWAEPTFVSFVPVLGATTEPRQEPTMSTPTSEVFQSVQDDSRALAEIYSFIQAHEERRGSSLPPTYRLSGSDLHDSIELTEQLHGVLKDVVCALSQGKSVSIITRDRKSPPSRQRRSWA